MSLLVSQLTPTSSSRHLTEQESVVVAARAKAELELRRRFGTDFETFVGYVRPTFTFHQHCQVLGKVLDRVASGELKRVMVFEPPRHGKSEEVSRLFPSHYLFKNPTHHVGLTSYSANLAYNLSRDARSNYEATGRKLDGDASAVEEWRTEQGGRFWSDGVGGAMTGKGFHLGIIDDPVKNREEAESETYRNRIWDWYTSTFYTRQEPGAAIVIVMTRWHDDDLAGRILKQEESEPECWHIVNFAANELTKENQFPATCTVEPDWRESDGVALCPERYDEKALAKIRSAIGLRDFSALYGQHPTVESGNIWKREWFEVYDDDVFNRNGHSVKLLSDGYDWDTAYTADEENSASAWVRSSIGSDGRVYVSEAGFDWLEFPDLVKSMEEKIAPHYIEAKATGKSAVQALSKMKIYASEVKVRGGDKIARTKIVTPLVESSKVRVHRSVYDKLLNDPRQGLLKFPSGEFTDLNDAFVQALNRHFPFDEKPEIVKKPILSTIEIGQSGEYIAKVVLGKVFKKMRQRDKQLRIIQQQGVS